MNEERYIEILQNPDSFDAWRHRILSSLGYAIGKEGSDSYVWYAPFDVANPLTLDEAWEHCLESARDKGEDRE